MDSTEYLKQTKAFDSSTFHGELVPFDYLLDLGAQIGHLAFKANAVKRAFYYGKPLAISSVGTKKTCQDLKVPFDLLHGALGAFTEIAELFQEVMKLTPESSTTHLVEELGDVEWYLACIYRYLDSLPEDARRANIAKLSARYPDKVFTKHHALNRDLAAEEKAIEASI